MQVLSGMYFCAILPPEAAGEQLCLYLQRKISTNKYFLSVSAAAVNMEINPKGSVGHAL